MGVLFEAEGEVDALWRKASGACVVGLSGVAGEPQIMPWNARELRVTDPDGRLLVFHEQANDAEASARMSAMLGR